MIKIINLKLLRVNGDVKFKAHGLEIDEYFHGEYEAGDKFCIDLVDTEFISIRLDDTLADSILYLPDGSFEFAVPMGYELARPVRSRATTTGYASASRTKDRYTPSGLSR